MKMVLELKVLNIRNYGKLRAAMKGIFYFGHDALTKALMAELKI